MGLSGEANIFNDDLYIGKGLVQLPLKIVPASLPKNNRGSPGHTGLLYNAVLFRGITVALSA